MNKAAVHQFGAWFMASVASIVVIFVGPQLAAESLTQQVISTVLGIPGFYVLYYVSSRVANWYRLRKFLGEWVYVTASYKDIPLQTGNYAKMTYQIDENGDLAYRVDLYRSYEAAVCATRVGWKQQRDDDRATEASFGYAISEAISHDPKSESVAVLFDVKFHDTGKEATDRKGRLHLSRAPDGSLTGTWVSDVNKTEISSGRMLALRPEDAKKKRFEAQLAAWADQSPVQPPAPAPAS